MVELRVAVERSPPCEALFFRLEAAAVGTHRARWMAQPPADAATLCHELVTSDRIPVDGAVLGRSWCGAGRHRFHTRAALPLTISSRSRGSASLNIVATMARELGKLVTGCG